MRCCKYLLVVECIIESILVSLVTLSNSLIKNSKMHISKKKDDKNSQHSLTLYVVFHNTLNQMK